PRRREDGERVRAPAARAGAGRRLAVRLRAGAGPACRGRGRDLDVHPVPSAATGRLDRLAHGGRHRTTTRGGIHRRELRPGRGLPQPARLMGAGPRKTGTPAQGAGKGKASMFTTIAGRAVRVTRATRGIAQGIAGGFAGAGARVLIVGRDAEAAKATVGELSATGAEASHVLADVSRREDCQQIAAAAAERFGGIDVLCANAGVFPAAPLAEMTD